MEGGSFIFVYARIPPKSMALWALDEFRRRAVGPLHLAIAISFGQADTKTVAESV